MKCALEEWVLKSDGVISKDDLHKLPECCKETWLGDPKGAFRQYRCVHGFHVREYETWFEVHRDVVDPRSKPIAHLLVDTDAPKVVVGLLALAAVRAVYG